MPGECRISDGSLDPSPAVHLEDAAVRDGAESGKIPGTVRIVILRAVEAALHVGKAEGADQPLRYAVALHDSQRLVFGSDFAAIGEFEAPELHVRVLALQVQIGLFDKNAGGVLVAVIRRVVVSTQAELSLRRGQDRMIRYPQEDGRGQFYAPVIAFLVLAEHQTQQRAGISIIAFTF